jgi:septal ring factor EnvC (AmiA/AmiB activator)
MSTIKTNLVGLGNYINNINGDLSQLLVSFDGYAKKMATELSGIKGNLSDVSIDMTSTKTSSVELKKQLETVEFMATSVRNDVTGLTTKIYNIKTSLFEQTNDLTSVKTSQTHIQVC